MKTKKICAAIALLTCTALTACSKPVKTSFNAYWRKVADTNETVNFSGTETAEYDVTFEEGTTSGLSVKYTNGKYVTKLSAKDGNYLYETKLTIDVQYFFNDETTDVFSDEVISSVTFESTQKGLKPLYSERKSVMHTPVTSSPTSLEGAYVAYYSSVVSDYATAQCTISSYENASFMTDETAKAEATITRDIPDDNDYSLIDNEELLVAVRAIASSSSETVFVYNTAAGALQKVQISQEAKKSTDFDFRVVGKEEAASTHTVSYVPFTVAISGKNSGSSQKVWVATDKETNEYRNIIVQMETSVSFGLGTLTYKLNSVEFLQD